MSRSKAFVLHLVVSLLLLLIPLYFSWTHWYTPLLFGADGGWQGFRMLAILSLLLGPGLTLLLFKPGKRGLWYDMVIVICLQIGILGWGSWTLYRERPVAIVYAEGYFIPVTAYQLEEAGVPESRLDTFDKTRPARIYVDLPEDMEQMQRYRMKALATMTPLYLFSDQYRPFDQNIILRIKQRGLDMENLFTEVPQDNETYQAFRQRHAQKQDAMIYVPLHARYNRKILVLDAGTGKVISSLDIVPPDTLKARLPAEKLEVRRPGENRAGRLPSV